MNSAPSSQQIIRHEVHNGRVVRAFSDRARDLYSMFDRARAADPDRDAVVCGGQRWSYAEVGERAAAFDAAFRECGVQPGDRVAIFQSNRADYLPALMGIWRAGAIAVPINVREGAHELQFLLEHSGARAVICEDATVERVRAATNTALLLNVDEPISQQGGSYEPAAVRDRDTAVILYTSGTTGRPKGAMLTHFNLIHSCLHYQFAFELRATDRAVLAVPASHVTGLVAIFLAMVGVGGCTLVMPSFETAAFLELAATERMTYTLMVPAMYNLCLLRGNLAAHDLQDWRVGGFGGAPMPEATFEAFAATLPRLALSNVYGATETASPSTIMPASLASTYPDSVGRAVACGDILIVDDEGREVPFGSPGEIWLAGPQVVPGYWNDPEATAKAFCGGYWRSGDVGSVSLDGFLRLHDRLRDVINRGGYKIYSAEVENTLAAHPLIAECAVVPTPDPVLGEKIQAYVVLKEGQLSLDEVRAFVRSRLADYKAPDFLTVRGSPLPRNANGKVLKRELRDATN